MNYTREISETKNNLWNKTLHRQYIVPEREYTICPINYILLYHPIKLDMILIEHIIVNVYYKVSFEGAV